jgi:hypothetical protein
MIFLGHDIISVYGWHHWVVILWSNEKFSTQFVVEDQSEPHAFAAQNGQNWLSVKSEDFWPRKVSSPQNQD